MKIETIFLNKTDIKRAKKFAKERTKDNDLYKKRGGFKEIDIVSGAMAEIGVYKFLKEAGVPVSKPDFTIYDKAKKSYDPDLTDGVHHFHVKGQTLESKQRYGSSWIMQRKDPIINDIKRMHYLVPCTVCTETGRVEIYGIISLLSLIQHGCISECKNEWFRKTKVAIYLDHIHGIMSNNAIWGFMRKWKERYERLEGDI